MSVRDVIIVGGGPTGLSAAIAAKQRGLDYLVVERGVLVNSIYRFPAQLVFFTTPELLEIGGLPFVSPYEKPTRAEALKYYRKVVDLYDLRIVYEEAVVSVEREAIHEHEPQNTQSSTLFVVETRSSRGVRRIRHARNVLLATGYFDRPVLLGVPGEDLPHVHHYYNEPHPYYRKRVVVVGGGNSSAEWCLDLYRTGAFVTLVHWRPELKSTIKYWVRPDIENRIKEGSIKAYFSTCVKEIRPTCVIVRPNEPVGRGEQRLRPERGAGAPNAAPALGWLAGGKPGEAGPPSESEREPSAKSAGGGAPAQQRMWGPASLENVEHEIPADAVFLLTGYRADTDLMCRAGIRLTEREGPVYNPETFETNVPGLFVAGGALAGVDTGTIFIENGRFHGEKIVETIASRIGT